MFSRFVSLPPQLVLPLVMRTMEAMDTQIKSITVKPRSEHSESVHPCCFTSVDKADFTNTFNNSFESDGSPLEEDLNSVV